MTRVNTREAKTHLSRYLAAAESGQVVTICRRNEPVAELRPIPTAPEGPGIPRFGLWDGFGVPVSFFEPLQDDLVRVVGGE